MVLMIVIQKYSKDCTFTSFELKHEALRIISHSIPKALFSELCKHLQYDLIPYIYIESMKKNLKLQKSMTSLRCILCREKEHAGIEGRKRESSTPSKESVSKKVTPFSKNAKMASGTKRIDFLFKKKT